MRGVAVGLCLAGMLAFSTSAGAAVVAQCGPSTGKSYYLSERNGGWSDDGISGGQFVFDVNGRGDFDIITTDARGRNVSAAGDGAVIVRVEGTAPYRTFLLISAYPGSGVVESYSVTTESTGARVLLWTTNKQNDLPNGKKMAAFVSACR